MTASLRPETSMQWYVAFVCASTTFYVFLTTNVARNPITNLNFDFEDKFAGKHKFLFFFYQYQPMLDI